MQLDNLAFREQLLVGWCVRISDVNFDTAAVLTSPDGSSFHSSLFSLTPDGM